MVFLGGVVVTSHQKPWKQVTRKKLVKTQIFPMTRLIYRCEICFAVKTHTFPRFTMSLLSVSG